MFENLLKFLKAPIDQRERLSVYAVAVRYTVNDEPKLSTLVVTSTSERCAIEKLILMVRTNNYGKKVVFFTKIANKANKSTVDRIKKDC